MKNNRLTIDDATRQQLTQPEIEELKKTAGGQEIIVKILASHTGLDEKTVFSKAKYTLRKTKKYLKRFTVLPVDLGSLIEYVTEKEPIRILEMREEALGLITAWSNAHHSGADTVSTDSENLRVGCGRWLVADDTGGLVVAALAERMGILYPSNAKIETSVPGKQAEAGAEVPFAAIDNDTMDSGLATPQTNGHAPQPATQSLETTDKPAAHRDFPLPASANTITLLHPAVQPNLSLLKYFGYDTNNPDPSHPLHSHLKPLSWLQLLHPQDDPTYREPEVAPESTMAHWKSGKRGTYFKKRRRWARCKSIVDEAREGDFDGLVVASHMDPASILPHAIPLVRGGGHVVVYSPTVEPLVKMMDLYSKERRAAYIGHQSRHPDVKPPEDDFPVDPRLLLAPTLQTSRVREWQVLPGRTHPLMTSRGGAEGYVFTARRVIPLEGGVEARGNFGKRRKVDADAVVNAGAANGTSEPSSKTV